MINEKLDKKFGTNTAVNWIGIKPTEVVTSDGVLVEVQDGETLEQARAKTSLDNDFEQTRKNLNSLLASGQEALQDAMILARSSEDPKSWQVVSNIITQIAAINEQMLDIHLKKQQHEQKKTEKAKPIKLSDETQTHVTNNAVFVGSNAELAQLISKMTNKGI